MGTGPNPPPPGPTPPGPTPPAPVPPVTPPIDGDGYQVLIIYETDGTLPLTAGQREIILGPPVRDFLNLNCITEADGKTKSWRIFDKDAKFTNPNDKWAKALQRPRAQVPWIIVSNGTTGYEGPLPNDPTACLELLKKYLPPQVLKTSRAEIKSSPPLMLVEVGPPRVVKPKVTMYSIKPCKWCDRFIEVDLDKLLRNPPYPDWENNGTNRSLAKYPSFLLQSGEKQKLLVGYHTAEKIREQFQILQAR